MKPNQVMILNSDKQLKAVILCDRLVWRAIPFTFEIVGIQYAVYVSEENVSKALEAETR